MLRFLKVVKCYELEKTRNFEIHLIVTITCLTHKLVLLQMKEFANKLSSNLRSAVKP